MMKTVTTAPEGADCEAPLRELTALCEGLRVACVRGEARGLTLADLEPSATLATLLAGELLRDAMKPDRKPVSPEASRR